MSVFVTTMYRYGDREKHSYVLGVWSSSEVAMQAGQTEALWRGGKYEPEVTEWKVDANEFDDIGEQRLTPLALDGAVATDNQQVSPADVLEGEGTLPEPPRQ
jgi:hypothetical protein